MREEYESNTTVQMGELKAHYEAMIGDMMCTRESELAEAIAADRKGFAARLEHVAEQNDFKLEELRIELSEMHSEDLEKALTDLKNEHNKELVELQASFEAHLKETSNKDKQLLTSQVLSMKDKCEEARTAALEALRVDLSERYSKDIAQAVKDATLQHEGHIEELTATLKKDYTQGISAEKQNFLTQLKEVETKSEHVLSIKLEELRAELSKSHVAQMSKALSDQLKDQETKSQQCLSAEREEFGSHLSEMTRVGEQRLSYAVEKLKAEHQQEVTSLQELHDKQQKAALESASKDFELRIAEMQSAQDLALQDLTDKLMESNNRATEDTVSKMLTAHERELEKLKASHLVEMREALAAKGVEIERHLRVLNASVEERQLFALEELRAELSEAHSVLLAQTIRDVKKNSEIEKQSVLQDFINTADEHHTAASKELVETLGKEGRDALEAQRVITLRERAADTDRMRGEISALTASHEAAIVALKAEALKVQQRQLEDQKRNLESAFKVTARDKEKASERALEASSVLLAADREMAVTNMRAQHVSHRESVPHSLSFDTHTLSLYRLCLSLSLSRSLPTYLSLSPSRSHAIAPVSIAILRLMPSLLPSGHHTTRPQSLLLQLIWFHSIYFYLLSPPRSISQFHCCSTRTRSLPFHPCTQDVALDKLRSELKKLRADALEAEMSHQKALGVALERSLEELSLQRTEIEAVYNRHVLMLL
jgi:hypothetical protein